MSRDAAAASQDDSSLWFGGSSTAAPVRNGMLLGGGALHSFAPQQHAETTSMTLTEMLRKRREAVEAHRKLAVPESIEEADAEVDTTELEPPADDASPPARAAAHASAAGGRQSAELRTTKKRPLCVHADMDQWLDACPVLPGDTRQTQQVVLPSSSHSPSVRVSTRRSGAAALSVGLAMSCGGPRTSSATMHAPTLRDTGSSGSGVTTDTGLLGGSAPRVSMESATRSMDAFFQAAANSGLAPHSPKEDRIDAILDADCPFDDMRMIAGAQVEAAPSRRRSGQAGAMNPTAFATIDWLNRSYEQWKASVDRRLVALSGTIQHVDTAFGIVSCVVEVSAASDEMRKRLTTNVSWPPPATHVVVVVDQSVYQALRLIIGDDVELGDPCFVFEGSVDTCFLPVVVASFCVCKAEHVAFQYHPLTDQVGAAKRMGDAAAGDAVLTQQQRHHHHHRQEPLAWPSSGLPAGRGAFGSAGDQTGGPTMDWFVPSELLDSLLAQYHRLVRAKNLSESDSQSDDVMGAPREFSTLSPTDAH